MAQGKVEICGVNTAKLPILNEKEKEALFVRIKAGDQEAKEEYIKGNLRLVLSVIRRFSASGENPDDLFQIGYIGLIKAINNFFSHILLYPFILYQLKVHLSIQHIILPRIIAILHTANSLYN